MLPHEIDQLLPDRSTTWSALCSDELRAGADARPGTEEDMSHLNRSVKRWIVSLCIAVAPAAALAQTLGSREHFTAAAIDTNRGAAGPIEIQVDRWSTDAQRDRLVKALQTKGADQTLDTLPDMPGIGPFHPPPPL